MVNKFAAPKIHCREGFDRIASGLQMPNDRIEPLYAAHETGQQSGDWRLHAKLVTDVLGYDGWRWPWMEECAAAFESLGIWPDRWKRRFVESPLNWRKVSPFAKVDFLVMAPSSATWTMVRLRDINDPNLLELFRPALIVNKPCEVSAYLGARYRPQIEARDFSVLPPFFPGDMCSLQCEYVRR